MYIGNWLNARIRILFRKYDGLCQIGMLMICFSPGHVCGVWEFWPWCRGPSLGLRSVWPVLPSILCWHQGTIPDDFIFLQSQEIPNIFFILKNLSECLMLHWQINKVVLSKGWRCLECTVCEACGQATDPGRLLLCDDCDISYHTYCLDPPLQNVPKDSWKCKWWAIFKSLKRESRRNDLERTGAVRTWNCWMHNCCFCFVDLCLWFESEQIEIYLIILKKVDLIFNTIHQMQLNWLLCQTRNSFEKNPSFVVFFSEVQLPFPTWRRTCLDWPLSPLCPAGVCPAPSVAPPPQA